MSHSQFQSKRFILRLAWLSLWEERMTTGRINQVAFYHRKHCECLLPGFSSNKAEENSKRRQGCGSCPQQFLANLPHQQSLGSDGGQIATRNLCFRGQTRPCTRKFPHKHCKSHHNRRKTLAFAWKNPLKHWTSIKKIKIWLSKGYSRALFDLPILILLILLLCNAILELLRNAQQCAIPSPHPTNSSQSCLVIALVLST